MTVRAVRIDGIEYAKVSPQRVDVHCQANLLVVNLHVRHYKTRAWQIKKNSSVLWGPDCVRFESNMGTAKRT